MVFFFLGLTSFSTDFPHFKRNDAKFGRHTKIHISSIFSTISVILGFGICQSMGKKTSEEPNTCFFHKKVQIFPDINGIRKTQECRNKDDFFRFHVTFPRFMMFCANILFFYTFLELKGVPKELCHASCTFLLKLLTKKAIFGSFGGLEANCQKWFKKR